MVGVWGGHLSWVVKAGMVQTVELEGEKRGGRGGEEKGRHSEPAV